MVDYVWVPLQIQIPNDLSDEEILEQVSTIVDVPIDTIGFEVHEPSGDVRLHYGKTWRYVTAVSPDAVKAMLSQ